MNNLTTRKIVLGLLMALVLAFSVQGTADAITSFTRGSGDLQLYAPGEDFTISFTASLHSRVVDTPADDQGNPATYYYDDQSIDITPSGTAQASIKKIGSTNVTLGTNALHTMSQMGEGAERLTSSRISVTLRAAQAGIVTITISDERTGYPTTDAPPDVPDLVFTVYIALAHNDTSTIDGPTPNVDFSIGEEQIDDDFTYGATPTANIRVNYTVSGSGSLLLKTDNNQRSGGKNLTTSSEAPVYLNMGGSTNKVTASIVGQRADLAETVTYIYGSATLTKESGDMQRGAVSSRLSNPSLLK